jgi:hypothetical protein
VVWGQPVGQRAAHRHQSTAVFDRAEPGVDLQPCGGELPLRLSLRALGLAQRPPSVRDPDERVDPLEKPGERSPVGTPRREVATVVVRDGQGHDAEQRAELRVLELVLCGHRELRG